MNDLHILDWSGAKRKVRFIGWNTAHTVCFMYDEQHARRAINLRLPSLFTIQFRESPDPKSPAVAITRTALHLPPCRASREEAEALHTVGSREEFVAMLQSPWELASHSVAFLEPGDEKKLAGLLCHVLARRRQEYEARKRKLTAMTPAQAKAELEILDREFSAMGPGGKRISVFDVTLDMVRKGWGGLRHKFLVETWAKKFGLNLGRIAPDARAFRHWLATRAVNERIGKSDPFLRLTKSHWEVLEAAVRYEIRFANGERCWLDGIEDRPLADATEVAEFDEVEKAQTPPSPPPWHSKDFGTIWRRNALGQVSESLPLSNEFRALCQLLAERSDQTAQFSEIQPQIGTRTHQLDTEAGQGGKASPTGARRLRQMLRTKTGKRLLQWGVLVETQAGREKFLKLSPPRTAE